jgi:trans-L-3-hydroxyproline dehydratase
MVCRAAARRALRYIPIVVTTIRTIDAHVAGEPLRLVVDGFPSPRGRTMLARRAWAARHADRVRRITMLEPRGHADMQGAVLTEPERPGSHAGLLFMDGGGFRAFSGHGVMAAATIARAHGLLTLQHDADRLVFDTPAGTVRVTMMWNDAHRVERVAMRGVPSFVLHAGVDVAVPGRRLRADIAFGGGFFAIVDAESAGVPVDGSRLADLRRVGMEVAAAVEARMAIAHPLEPGLEGIDGTIFTAPPQAAGADLRSAVVSAAGAVDRSPSGAGTAAVMAVLDAMGLLSDGQRFVHEGLLGTTLVGRMASRTHVADLDAVVSELEGTAWITGEHTFVLSDEDPLGPGFSLG